MPTIDDLHVPTGKVTPEVRHCGTKNTFSTVSLGLNMSSEKVIKMGRGWRTRKGLRTVCWFAVAVLILIGGLTTVCHSVVVEFDLERMIWASRLIVVGKVIKIVETADREPYHRGVATIEVEQVLKGSFGKTPIVLHYMPRLSTSAGFDIGERCLFFINDWEGKDSVVQGYAGKLRIEDGTVYVSHIRGEEKTQKLDDFIEKVKSLEKLRLERMKSQQPLSPDEKSRVKQPVKPEEIE